MGLALRMIVQRCKHRWTFRDGETVTMIQRTAEQALRECGK
jgi:hypothetical protein